MKRYFILSTVLMLFGMLWGETRLDITPTNDWSIPYSYNQVVQRTDGSLQFYRCGWNNTNNHLDIFGFSFDPTTGDFSAETHIVDADIPEQEIYPYCERHIVDRFDRFYYIVWSETHVYTYILNGNTQEEYYDINYGIEFSTWGWNHCPIDVVAENQIVFADTTEIHSLNTATGTLSTLYTYPALESIGDYSPFILYIPEGKFLFVIDYRFNTQSDEYKLFSADGQLLNSQTFPFSDDSIEPYASDSTPRAYIDDCFYCASADYMIRDMCVTNYQIQIGDDNSINITAYNYMDPECLSDLCPFATAVAWGNHQQIQLFDYCDAYGVFPLPFGTSVDPADYNPDSNTGKDALQISAISSIVLANHSTELSVQAFIQGNASNPSEYTFPLNTTQSGMKAFSYGTNAFFAITAGEISTFNFTELVGNTEPPVVQHQDLQLYPNPLTAGTALSIKPSLDRPGKVDIYNIKGQKVRSLATTGSNAITWDRKDTAGQDVASGIYMVRYQAEDVTQNQKCVIVK